MGEKVRIKGTMLKSRQPLEHHLVIVHETGKIIQDLDDGYFLIEFDKLRIYHGKVKGRKILIPLQWYVHKNDFDVITKP